MAQPITVKQTDLRRTAARLFPTAVLYLGDRADARAAVTEAIAAMQKGGAETALPQLLRICRTREQDQIAAELILQSYLDSLSL